MLQALGDHLILQPIEDVREFGDVKIRIRNKIRKGKAVSIAKDVDEIKPGDIVYHLGGSHNRVDNLILVRSIHCVGYEEESNESNSQGNG